jgi:hypothetical protein
MMMSLLFVVTMVIIAISGLQCADTSEKDRDLDHIHSLSQELERLDGVNAQDYEGIRFKGQAKDDMTFDIRAGQTSKDVHQNSLVKPNECPTPSNEISASPVEELSDTPTASPYECKVFEPSL